MIKNVFLKKMLKSTIFKGLTLLNRVLPKDDSKVLLYISAKRLEHSLVPLRNYLLEKGYDKKYDLICGIDDLNYAESDTRIRYVDKFKSIMIFLRAKHVFYTAGQIPIKPSAKQIVIHMSHGNADFKSMGLDTNINNGDEFFFTYMCTTGSIYKPIYARAYGCSESNIAVVGDPLGDLLLQDDDKEECCQIKSLVWLPTFRQSDLLGYNDSSIKTLLPLFDEDEYGFINSLLAKHNIQLLIKLHPAQTVHDKTRRFLSHLKIYSHQDFINEKLNIYELLAKSDGLIGDYSSVSMQYLLKDKPMAFVVPDIEEYKRHRGFCFEDPEAYMGGHIIKTQEEFVQFINDFAVGNDLYAAKRRKIRNVIHQYQDANSTQRIVELSNMHL